VELSGYLAVARRWWWTLLVATWVAALSGYLVASRITPTYEATAQVLVGPINTDIDTIRAAQQLAQTYAQLAISQPLLESTAKELGGTVDARILAQNVRASANDFRFVTIKADDADPQRAALIANTITTELSQLTSGATTRPEGQIQITSQATPPTSPIAPQVSLIVLLATLAGLLGGLVLVILIEYLSDTVKDRFELGRLTQAPLLGVIDLPPAAWTPGSPPVVESMPSSAAGVTFRQVATKLVVSGPEGADRRILIVGVGQPQSSIVAANVATAAAFSGHSVALVDGSPDGEVSRRMGVTDLPGLGDLVSGATQAVGSLLVTRPSGLRVLPRGSPGRVERINPTQAEMLLDSLGALSDIVIVDGGMIETSAAALAWAQATGATALVLTLGETKRDSLRVADESLRLVGATGLGAVLLRRSRGRGARRSRVAPTNSATIEPQAAMARIAVPVPAVEPRPELSGGVPVGEADLAGPRPTVSRSTPRRPPTQPRSRVAGARPDGRLG
jgi:capsular polysaccharide biosynthesis protein/Mrp family chromosome partitioning ATPase